MGSPRLRGTTLSMLVDGTDFWADAVSVVMDGEDEQDTWVGQPTVPRPVRVRSWFDVEAVQSTDPASFWTFLYEHQGADVPFAYCPHGNPVPSPEQPHFTGILALPDAPPPLGGRAGRAVSQTFTTRLHIIQGPLRVTTQ